MNRKKLESLVYKHTHADFKGRFEDGTRTILKFVPSVGTCVVALSSLTDEELVEKLPRKVRESAAFDAILKG